MPASFFLVVGRLTELYDGLMESLKSVDSSLHIEVIAEIEKELTAESSRAVINSQKMLKISPEGSYDQALLLL